MDTPKILVVILGMHRSGTSLITHILSETGFFVGEDSDLIKAGKWNQKGYFERWSVLKINDRILDLGTGSWLNPPEEKKIFQIALDQPIKHLLNTYNGHQYAVIKDPRLCLTFPVWKRVFDKNVRVIITTRNPDATAISLHKRFGISLERWLALGNIYNERALKYASDYPVFHIKYEDLLSTRREFILSDLFMFLGVKGELNKKVENIIDPSLQHNIGMTPGAQYEDACRLMKENEFEKAFSVLETLLSFYPEHALANNDLGVLYQQKGEERLASKYLKQAFQLEPDSKIIQKNISKIGAEPVCVEYRDVNNPDRTDIQKENQYKKIQWFDYPRFNHSNVKVLIVSLRHLLLHEVQSALIKLGHSCNVLFIENKELDSNCVEEMFNNAIKKFKPDFVLTINHLGFDKEGIVTDLLTHYSLPFASWYVDSPQLIINHYARNKSPFLTLFLWDQDYIEISKQIGFSNVEYLPLGVDENLFKPIGMKDNHLSHLSAPVSFVGNSMQMKVNSVLNRNRINGALLGNFHKISEAFLKSHHLVVRDMLKENFPNLIKDLYHLSDNQAFGYEAGVTWQATRWYRTELVKKLKPFNPLIIGDIGWRDLLDEGFRFHHELNYYNDLPFFYNANKINFNATSRQMKNGVNQRVFDIPACRSIVVTDWTSQLENLMEPGREVVAYQNKLEIHAMVDRLIKDKVYAGKIIDAGYRRVLNHHTYAHRLRQLVSVMRRNYG